MRRHHHWIANDAALKAAIWTAGIALALLVAYEIGKKAPK